MPWKTVDATKFTKKAKSGKAKRQWRDVANNTRGSMLAKGFSAKEADRRAAIYANAAVKKRKAKTKRKK